MKVLRITTVTIFVIVSCVFAWFYMDTKLNLDTTMPQIQIEGDMLEVSIHDEDAALLQGVTAYDGKDGDISHKVLVESISQFSEQGLCTVVYAVADNDKHVAKNSRQIRYTDYKPPRFTLNKPALYTVGESVDVRKLVGAQDDIDGDISDKVVVTATDYMVNTIGTFKLSLQATNNKGDMIYLDLPIFVEENNVRRPVIELKEYMLYVEKGETPDFASYVESVTSPYYKVDAQSVMISQDFDPHTPGVYSVHYYVWDSADNQGHTVMTVVVEE